MSNFLRLAAVLSCLGVPILGAVFLNAIGLLLPSVQTGAAKKTVVEEPKLKEQLRQHQEAFQRSKQARLQVAEEVIAGRLRLAEALEAFRRLQGQRLPYITKQDVLKSLKMSETEWLGQRVLYYVEQVLFDRPEEAAAVIALLKKELEEILADRKKRPAASVKKPSEPSR